MKCVSSELHRKETHEAMRVRMPDSIKLAKPNNEDNPADMPFCTQHMKRILFFFFRKQKNHERLLQLLICC